MKYKCQSCAARNLIIACVLRNLSAKKCEAAHNSNEYNLHVAIMATNSSEREAVFCLGCGSDLCERTGDRRVLTSPATRKILPVWREIVSRHLEATGQNIDIEELCKPGYMCRKCVRAYERFQREKVTLSTGVEAAIAHIITSAPDSPRLPTSTSSTSCSGRKRAAGGYECASAPKRTAFDSTSTTHSPAVVVR